ncbi:MAG: TRZ/ATZ family hydrolase [Woeseiaceae bacterium]
MKNCDLLVSAGWVATVGGNNGTIRRGSVAVSDGKIIDVGTQAELRDRWQPRETIERPRSVLIPGLINSHTHAAMSLFRGIADDLPLQTWLTDHIWPAEARHISADMVRDGTRLAMAEMIRSGTTCFNDMYFFPDTVAEAASEARMRTSIGLIVIEFETAWAKTPDEYLQKAMAVYDAFAQNPLVTMQFAPHSPYAVSEETLQRIHTQADQLDIGVHTHLHETAGEIDTHLAERSERPFAQLDRIGLINNSLVAVHMTQLTDEEIARSANRGISVIHCPESNLKLASGMAPIAKLIAAGVNVALGTDGAASNNDLDMLGEMKTAALLGKGVAQDASAMSASQVLEMATLNGAKALRLDDSIGSLETGKWADMVCVDLDTLHTTPTFDPISCLVYSAGRDNVTDVWVAGRQLLNEKALTTIDEQAVKTRARDWEQRVQAS